MDTANGPAGPVSWIEQPGRAWTPAPEHGWTSPTSLTSPATPTPTTTTAMWRRVSVGAFTAATLLWAAAMCGLPWLVAPPFPSSTWWQLRGGYPGTGAPRFALVQHWVLGFGVLVVPLGLVGMLAAVHMAGRTGRWLVLTAWVLPAATVAVLTATALGRQASVSRGLLPPPGAAAWAAALGVVVVLVCLALLVGRPRVWAAVALAGSGAALGVHLAALPGLSPVVSRQPGYLVTALALVLFVVAAAAALLDRAPRTPAPRLAGQVPGPGVVALLTGLLVTVAGLLLPWVSGFSSPWAAGSSFSWRYTIEIASHAEDRTPFVLLLVGPVAGGLALLWGLATASRGTAGRVLWTIGVAVLTAPLLVGVIAEALVEADSYGDPGELALVAGAAVFVLLLAAGPLIVCVWAGWRSSPWVATALSVVAVVAVAETVRRLLDGSATVGPGPFVTLAGLLVLTAGTLLLRRRPAVVAPPAPPAGWGPSTQPAGGPWPADPGHTGPGRLATRAATTTGSYTGENGGA